MSEPHWVWATDVNTKQRIPVNLGAMLTMLPVKRDGIDVTALFFGGVACDAQGAFHYAQVQVLETIQTLFASPKIKLGRQPERKLPPEIAKLAAPHKPGKAA